MKSEPSSGLAKSLPFSSTHLVVRLTSFLEVSPLVSGAPVKTALSKNATEASVTPLVSNTLLRIIEAPLLYIASYPSKTGLISSNSANLAKFAPGAFNFASYAANALE